MEPFYFLDFIRDNSYLNHTRYDNLRYELDKHFHYYGDHFKFPYEVNRNTGIDLIKTYIKLLFALTRIVQKRKSTETDKIVLSNAYFSVNEELAKLGYKVFYPCWQIGKDKNVLGSWDILVRIEKIKYKLKKSNFNELIKEEFTNEIKAFEEKMTIFFQKNKVKSLFVPNDESFFENLSILICKQIGIPSFVFLHGLPGRYNQLDENRSDYLIVWGEKIKENYIKSGINPDKIFISGHPYYKKLNYTPLKFSFNNILVITKSLNGAHHSDGVILADRSNLLLYLFSIEKILIRFGVRSVRFRPHPSENANWYMKFINNDFYIIDKGNLPHSILNSTLIIGPTSTVFLESLYYGVNYLVYEPSLNNIDLINTLLVPPFDGSDSKIPVSKNEDELEYMLQNKIKVDPTCLKNYLTTPFDLSFVKNLI
jgi:hypothetical protein